MALIGNIRKNPILVLLFIGGGIALFVLSDIMNSGSRGPIGPAEAMMARVGEVEIERNDFERTLAVAGNNADAFQSRDNLWNFYLQESLVRNETDALGLTVTKPELDELTYGPRFSPVIRQNYSDRQTGQMDPTFLNQVRSQIEAGDISELEQRIPNFVDTWKFQNRQVSYQRLQEKLSSLVSKGMYAPTWMAQEYADAQSGNRSVAVVRIPFDEIDNDQVEVTDADLEAYVAEYRGTFDNAEETRQLAYVSFTVDATEADSSAVRDLLNELKNEWSSTTAREDSLFAITNNGSYGGTYITEDQIVPSIADRMMNEVEVGQIYGPFVESQVMALAKLVDRREIADSATVRRIVRNVALPTESTEANRLLDSLRTELQTSDRNFSELAAEFNQDPRSRATNGVIENVTPGQLQPEVNRVVFIDGEVGRFYKVTTATTVQLVEVVQRSAETSTRVKVAYVTEPMIPSNETEDNVRARAETFLTGKSTVAEIKTAAREAGLTVETTTPLGIGTFEIPGLGDGQDVRDMICWAYGAGINDVSGFVYTFTDPNFFFENKYAVVGLENVLPKGEAPLEALREGIENTVRDRLKGRKLAEELAGMDLGDAASRYTTVIDTLRSVNFTLNTLPQGIGNEPRVIAAAANGSTNAVSAPIVGNNGVYLIKPLSDAPTGSSGSLPTARLALNSANRGRVSQQLLTGLRADMEIDDRRVSTECSNLR